MTAQKLYATLKFIDALDTQLGLQTTLDSIRELLTNLVGSPAHPQYQKSLADALARFQVASAKLGQAITPSQGAVIAEMDGSEFFDPSIAVKVSASISANAMTPSVARDFVQDLASRRAAFLTTVTNALHGLEKLNVSDAGLQPGHADLAFLIPRDLFKNQLGAFAKELNFISQLIQHVSEGVTGEMHPVELEGLSSSVPTIAVVTGLKAIETLATIVNKFLEAWDKIAKIRKVRSDLCEIGMKGTAVEELTEQITTTVNEVIEESTEIILINYKGESGRKNELTNALRQDTRRLFGQIERGLTMEFRAEPKANADEEDAKALETVSKLGRQMQFPLITNEPMLLESAEILEGDIHTVKHVKKSTTTKITTSKTSKDGKHEPKAEV